MLAGLALLFSIFMSCHRQGNMYESSSQTEKKVDSLLVLMTLDEKIGQLQQLSVPKNMNDSVFDLVRKGKVGSFLNPGNPEMRNKLQKAYHPAPGNIPPYKGSGK